MEKPWKNHETPMENHEKNMVFLLENHGHLGMKVEHASFMKRFWWYFS